jgi:hypothetical protein
MRYKVYSQQGIVKKLSFSTWLMTALLLVMALALPLSAQVVQGSYVYVNNQGPVNSIAAFSVSPAGSLTQLAGSPMATGGSGVPAACRGLNRITIGQGGNTLFVSNSGEQTISAFTINPANGALTPVAGSPFASGLALDSCQGISLAATPDGLYLMAASNGQVNTFNIGLGGVLTANSSLASCCSPNAGMKIISNGTGQFVALSNLNSVSVFSINVIAGSVVLAPVAGSPFPQTGTGSIAGLETTCAGDRLYGSETGLSNTTLTDAWSVASTGVLTPISGSPFSAAGSGGNTAVLTPDNELLFASNQFSDTINPAALLADGSLASFGSVSGVGFSHAPVGIAIDPSGTYLFAADEGIGVASFRINPRATLGNLADVAINRPGDIQDLVAYPTRSCAIADLSLAVTTTPAPIAAGQPVIYTVSITNHGPSIASAVVADTLDVTTTAGGIIPIVSSNVAPFGAVRANAVSGITVNGVVTINTLLPHELVAGQLVRITSVSDPSQLVSLPTVPATTVSVTDPSFAGVFTIVSVTPTSFTYNQVLQRSQFVGPPLPIVAATGAARVSNTVTITTTQPYTLSAGDVVTIASVADSSFNGAFTVASVASTTSFTYSQTAPDATSGGGVVIPPSPVPATDTGNGGTATATPCNISAGGTGICGPVTNPAATPIVVGSGASRTSGIVTIATTAPHQLFTGEIVTLAGVLNNATMLPDPTLNGSFTVTSVLSPLTFTFDQSNLSPVPPDVIEGSGTVTSAACSGICSGVISPVITPIVTASRANSASGTVVSGIVTITTAEQHQLFAGETVHISGVPDPTVTLANPNSPPGPPTLTFTDAGFNGIAIVTSVPSPTTFTYAQSLALSQFGETNNLPTAFPLTAVNTSAGGTASSPQTTFATFPVLQVGETQTFTFTATTIGLTTAGATISNTAIISNKSTIDPNPSDNVASSLVTIAIGASPTTLTVAPATGGYGGLAILSAQLVRVSNGTSVAGETITFSVLGSVMGTAVTNNAGQAILTISIGPSTAFPAGIALGSYSGAVSASFAGDTSFGASIGTGNLTVNPGVLTVVPTPTSRIYGSANPTFAYGITGFQNGDTSAVVSGAATCSSTATATSPAGNYPITCVISGLAAANYTFTTINGTLAITQAPLTITANDASRNFGVANPAFTGVIAGLLNTDVITATYDSPATPSSGVGTYPIIPTPVGVASVLANYAITLTNGVLTVNPVVVSNAPLTVTVNSVSRAYGDPNPAFTATISGALNGDVFTATLSTPATAASPVGAYPITATVSGPTTNYVVTVVNGVLTVNPASLSIVVASATRLYGAANPAFTGTIGATKNGDIITATYGTTATVLSDVGSFAITPTLAGAALGNYAPAITNGFLTITPAPLAITAVGGVRLYGAANPAATITGLLNGDPITTIYTFPTPATIVGVYTLSPTIVDPAGKIGDYTVTIRTATLTINKAPLTVTASPASRPYGSANPVLTAVFGAGQVQNGDAITPVATTTATNTSNAGTYPITVGVNDPTGLLLPNYAVTAVNSTLTVTTVPLTITADPKSMPLGGTVPTFTASYAGFVLGQSSATLGGALKCAATTTTGGLHPITCTGQTSPNYAITFVPGTLTINYLAACKNGPGLAALAPLSPNPPLPTFSKAATASVPVSFRGCDAHTNSVSSPIIAPTVAGGPGGVTLIDPNGANVAAAAPTFGFAFANTAWTFNFTTAGRTTGVYTGTITLNDGTVVPFSFRLNN